MSDVLEDQPRYRRLPPQQQQGRIGHHMKIFVWSGQDVLANYKTGMVVVAAENVDEAWKVLEHSEWRAWFRLQTGVNYIYEKADLEVFDKEDYPTDWKIPQPQEFTVENLPVLVIEGGE